MSVSQRRRRGAVSSRLASASNRGPSNICLTTLRGRQARVTVIAAEKGTDLAAAVLRLLDPGLMLLEVPFLAAFLADIHMGYAAAASHRAPSDALPDSGAIDELRARADAGDRHAAGLLAGLLLEPGNLDELRAVPTPATNPPPSGWPAC